MGPPEGTEENHGSARMRPFTLRFSLVAIEPVSDFIVLETYAEKRDAKTWNAAVSKALAD